MTSSVNSLPPPFPNQALAQAREAGQIPADTNKSAEKDSDSVVASSTKPPAVDKDDSGDTPSDSQRQASSEDANSRRVNIEA